MPQRSRIPASFRSDTVVLHVGRPLSKIAGNPEALVLPGFLVSYQQRAVLRHQSLLACARSMIHASAAYAYMLLRIVVTTVTSLLAACIRLEAQRFPRYASWKPATPPSSRIVSRLIVSLTILRVPVLAASGLPRVYIGEVRRPCFASSH